MTSSQPDRALRVPSLFDGERWHHDCGLLLLAGCIDSLVPGPDIPAGIPCEELSRGYLAPGFIDLQVNGGGGMLFNNTPTVEALEHISASHRQGGTTSLLPTLLSDTRDVYEAGVTAVRGARRMGIAGILGIHIEGPFFAQARRGTHRADRLRIATGDDIDWLCRLTDLPRVLTLAPELMLPGQIRRLVDAGVMVCAGHSNASFTQVQQACSEGLRGFTHLFNAMSPLSAREPGVTGAALSSVGCWLGIIADGHHVHPASIRIAQRCAPPGKLYLVSDAMATAGSDRRSFELYGEIIEERDGRLVNSEGSLAGSAITMVDGVRYCHEKVGLALEECLRMASLYPAQFLDEPRLGRIAPGCRADLVLLDDALRVKATWVAGNRINH
ncbi:N-acetylglucosamine-6-phosphate deacetylase [Kineobactrum sediminis]|uniref:N-acetylglucosamine-6-phosphate deacetylase n=1 Tax=Kineobactrum sediminis TaxID=1905677 RepID=A0A2N5XYG8_9GAMM|nr:N-acetylglucosamine-6-phosphate deacetylase [Kineobactrum sediminis]PLW81162.1 N-acetylglucosamine-6-phosphate deacetylase [Kineobactrum sediminis]